ncbi:MAG: hypothetical protein ACW97A_10065 [Candidatus Thorarchaeota archaeon]|jgi:hypothetical protein
MTDFERLHEMARADVETCIEVWKEILERLDIEYAYAKGSATKKWESPIDYVPEISDVDIHIFLKDDTSLLQPSNEFADAMNLSATYERRFHEVQQEPLHMPRSQIMLISHFKSVIDYTPPRIQDVRILFGNVIQEELPDIETIRRCDLNRLGELDEFLSPLPMRVKHRAGLDLWSIIRPMTWRVSPSPVRILSQTHNDPISLWSWNRTRIEKELRNQDYEQIADSYRGYYESGWELFLSEFKSREAFRSTLVNGYNLLKDCYKVGLKLSQS